MEPIKTYEYLTLARGRLLSWVCALSPEDYAREFPIGRGTLARTLTHIMISEWYYALRIEQSPVPRYEEWTIRDETPLPFDGLEAAWGKQAARTRSVLAAVRDWDTPLQYEVIDEGRRVHVSASPSDIFTQLVLHEVHHRAQAMAILRQLGVSLEDLDYNAFMYERRDVGAV